MAKQSNFQQFNLATDDVSLSTIDTLTQLHEDFSKSTQVYNLKHASNFGHTLFKLLLQFEFGVVKYEKDKSKCQLYQQCLKVNELLEFENLETKLQFYILRRSFVSSENVIEYLINIIDYELHALQSSNKRVISKEESRFASDIIHSLVHARQVQIDKDTEQFENANQVSTLTLQNQYQIHVPEVRTFKKGLKEINFVSVLKNRAMHISEQKGDETIKLYIHPLFDVLSKLKQQNIQMHLIKDTYGSGLVVGIKDFNTFMQYQTVQAQLDPLLRDINKLVIDSDEPLAIPVIDPNQFEKGTYVHCFPFDFRKQPRKDNHIQQLHPFWNNTTDKIRIMQESILARKDNNPIVFEISFLNYELNDQLVHVNIDEGVLHKFATTKLERVCNETLVDFNQHTKDAFENGHIAQNNYQLQYQPRFGELKDSATMSGYGLFYCICESKQCALAVVCNLIHNFIGALSVFEPEIHLSKRQLKVPQRIAKLAPIDYEYKISNIHLYATKHIDEIAMHATNKLAFYKNSTVSLFSLGNLLKGQIIYGVNTEDMSKHPLFIVKMGNQPIVSYLYHYRVRGGIIASPWCMSEGMTALQTATQSSSSMKDFQKQFGKYEFIKATYLLLSTFGTDVSLWNVNEYLEKQLDLVKNGHSAKYTIDELNMIMSQVTKMPTLRTIKPYSGTLQALPIPPTWSVAIKDSIYTFFLYEKQVTHLGQVYPTLSLNTIYAESSNEYAFISFSDKMPNNEISSRLREDTVAYQQQVDIWTQTLQGQILLKLYDKSQVATLEDKKLEPQLPLDSYQVSLRIFNNFNIPRHILTIKRKMNQYSGMGKAWNTNKKR